MITDYAVSSLALNNHCKNTKSFIKVFIVICVHAWELMQERICMKCPHTSNVEGDQYFSSQHAWACWDMVARGIQIPVKTSCTGHRWGKTKRFFCFLFRENLLGMFSRFLVLLFYVSSLSGTQNKGPNSHRSHPVHLFNTWIFIMNVKCRMDGSHRKPYICFSFDFLIQYSANGTV